MRKPQTGFAVLALAALAALTFASTALAEGKGEKGQKFQLFGTATDGVDPQNATNEVLEITLGSTADVGGATRMLAPDTQAEEIDNQVQLKYHIVGPTKTCVGGSPRFQLSVDTDGDGASNGNAFGYIGDLPFGGQGTCPQDTWTFEDMTNNVAKWDLSQLGGSMTNTWDQMEAFLAGADILRGSLVEDAFMANQLGTTYYDNVVIGNRTLNDSSDTAP